jgi:hypothetical protein
MKIKNVEITFIDTLQTKQYDEVITYNKEAYVRTKRKGTIRYYPTNRIYEIRTGSDDTKKTIRDD